MGELELLLEYKELLEKEKELKGRKEKIKESLMDLDSKFLVMRESKRESIDKKKLMRLNPKLYKEVMEVKTVTSLVIKV
jgi:hypothetical protein